MSADENIAKKRGKEDEDSENDEESEEESSENEDRNVGYFAHKMRQRKAFNPNFLAAIQNDSEVMQEFWAHSVWQEDDGSEYVPEDASDFADEFDSDYDSDMDENEEDNLIKVDAAAQDDALAKAEKGKKSGKNDAYVDPAKAAEAQLAESQKHNKFIKRPAWLKQKDNEPGKTAASTKRVVRLDHLWFAENFGPNVPEDVLARERALCDRIHQAWRQIKEKGATDTIRDRERQNELMEGIKPVDFDAHSVYLQKMEDRRLRRLMPIPRGILDEKELLQLRRSFLPPHIASLYVLPTPLQMHGGAGSGRGGRKKKEDASFLGGDFGIFWPSCSLSVKPTQSELLMYGMFIEQKMLCLDLLKKEINGAGNAAVDTKKNRKKVVTGPFTIFNSTLTDRIWHYLEETDDKQQQAGNELQFAILEAQKSKNNEEKKKRDLAKRRKEVEGVTGPFPYSMQSCSAERCDTPHDDSVISSWQVVLFTDPLNVGPVFKEGEQCKILTRDYKMSVRDLPPPEWRRDIPHDVSAPASLYNPILIPAGVAGQPPPPAPTVEGVLSASVPALMERTRLLNALQICRVSGQKAKFRDPLTGWGYADKEAFRILREKFQSGEIPKFNQKKSDSVDNTSATPYVARLGRPPLHPPSHFPQLQQQNPPIANHFNQQPSYASNDRALLLKPEDAIIKTEHDFKF